MLEFLGVFFNDQIQMADSYTAEGFTKKTCNLDISLPDAELKNSCNWMKVQKEQKWSNQSDFDGDVHLG